MSVNIAVQPNPWLSVWTRPRGTLRWIVSDNPGRSVVILAALNGFAAALSRAEGRNLGERFPWQTILAFAAVIGPITGVILLWLLAALTRLTGSWIGGAATPLQLRAAIAWSFVPQICTLILLPLQLLLFGQHWFTGSMPNADADPLRAYAWVGITAVQLVAAIWSFVILLHAIAEVQGFTVLRALGNLLLSGLVLVAVILAIVLSVRLLR